MGVKSGSQMISFFAIGNCSRTGSRSSAACWFSVVQQMVTLGYPVPQSGGKQAATRNKRLVMIKKCKSERKRIIAQISGRQLSASGKKKSELRQV